MNKHDKLVFPGNNTANGFHSFYRSGLQGMERVFILKGGPGTGKSTLMRKIGLELKERDYDIEYWQCSSDNDSLDGVIIPRLKIAIIDGTAPHIVDPVYPGVVEEIVHLGDLWNENVLQENKFGIIKIVDTISDLFSSAYEKLALAGAKEKQIIKICDNLVDVNLQADLEKELLDEIIHNDQPLTRHLFSSAITPKGVVNNAINISANMEKRYILKGNVGSAQSRLMIKIIEAAMKQLYPMEIYHSYLLPEVIEMIILPVQKIAIIAVPDGEIDFIRDGDKVIYCNTILDKSKEFDKGELGKLVAERDKFVADGVKEISKAHNVHDDLEEYYIKAMDFSKVELLYNQLLTKIINISKNSNNDSITL